MHSPCVLSRFRLPKEEAVGVSTGPVRITSNNFAENVLYILARDVCIHSAFYHVSGSPKGEAMMSGSTASVRITSNGFATDIHLVLVRLYLVLITLQASQGKMH